MLNLLHGRQTLRHIALTAPLASQIDSHVEQGRYASASEMVRTALRLLIERDETMAGASALAGTRGRQTRADRRS